MKEKTTSQQHSSYDRCIWLIFSLTIVLISLSSLLNSKTWAKDLKPRQSAYQLAQLLVQIYQLETPSDAADQVKRVIREGLDQQWRGGFLPIDAYGVLPKTEVRPIVKMVSELWRSLPKRPELTDSRREKRGRADGILSHDQLKIFLNTLLSPSPQRSKRFNILRSHSFASKEGPIRNSTGLIETSYSLAMENMVRLSRRLKRWRKRYSAEVKETIDLFNQSLTYLKKIHQRGELISSEQYAIIQLSLGVCHLALKDLKSARQPLIRFFNIPSSGESMLLLRGLITDINAAVGESSDDMGVTALDQDSTYDQEQRFDDAEASQVESSPDYELLQRALKRWSSFIKGERNRMRRLKGQTRDILQRTVKMKQWWSQKIVRVRKTLQRSESTLAIEQLLVSLAHTAQSSQLIAMSKNPIEWTKIPSGTLWAPPEEQADQRGHQVTFSNDFWIAKHEVSVAQYQTCVDEQVCTPAHWNLCANSRHGRFKSTDIPTNFRSDKRPIVCVDWQQARTFSRWVGGDLPTETEWMYAAQGGQSSPYPWGHHEPTCERAIFSYLGKKGCGYQRTWDVCTRPLGHSVHGLCDMAGNVWEWVLDMGRIKSRILALPLYRENGEANCITASCTSSHSLRISRGGGWGSPKDLLKTNARAAFQSIERHPNLGFRPVKRIK